MQNLKNVNFRIMLIDFMRTLSKHEITAVMEKANAEFFKYHVCQEKERHQRQVCRFFQKYKCFGIILPDDMFHQYIEKWFYCLIKTDSTERFIKENRLLKRVSFRTALQFYMRQLNKNNVASIIRTCSKDFLNTMFVMTEIDVIHCAKKPNERFGIVIPDGMLQDFIDRWFDVLRNHVVKNEMNNTYMMSSGFRLEIEETRFVGVVQNKNRPLKNFAFGNALRIYTKKLTTEQIASLIHTSGDFFLNTMFVMTEHDINDSAKNRYEWFGIVIQDNMLQQYIERIFNGLTNESLLVEYIDINRVLNNPKGRAALCTHMKQLTKEKTAALLQNARHIFFNTMFVMTEEDIKDNAKYRYECFGIVIPDDLVQQYIERWFDDLTKTSYVEVVIQENRPLNNVTFRSMLRTFIKQLTTDKICLIIQSANNDFINKMFVMTEDQIRDNADNGYECLGIVIPHVLLQKYIQRWFEDLTKADHVDDILDKNRLLLNITFYCAVKTYIKQLTTEQIASIIQTKKINILNTLFVMTENDIKSDEANQHKCLCIVIPDDLVSNTLRDCLIEKKKIKFVNPINENIALMSVKLRSAVQEDIKDDFSNRHECFGIVIPDDLLQQYIVRLFECLTVPTTLEKFSSKFKGNGLVENFLEICRPLNTVRFHTALRTYMRQLNTDKIGYLIQTARYDFINTMFVMTEDDINDNSDNQYERFGIVMPNDLLQQYIARWFAGLVKKQYIARCFEYLTQTSHYEIQRKDIVWVNKTCSIANFMGNCRPLKNARFRAALRIFMSQLNTEKIGYLIQNAGYGFINTMFVMTEEDVNDNARNRYECIGIIIPDDLLEQYIKRWFNDLAQTDCVEKYINMNRPLNNASCRTQVLTYIRQLDEIKIGTLIQTGSRDFVNTMFVVTKEDIKDKAENKCECFGIILPGDLLQQYIERLFDGLTQANLVKKSMNANRCFMHGCFRKAINNYTQKLTRGKIGNLIRTASIDFVSTIFVMTEDDIKDDVEKRNECIGVVIPDDLLNEYIERWFDGLTKTHSAKQYIDVNRTFVNSKFQANLDSYINGINAKNLITE
ncbi:unnamed protein product [Mytilus edulis]|uniref:Uncharacterized protein n=1 Tax=Mytilus edulis TaxID=6550 RepID=A0A8S3QT78_MYTED|nr:unnamed protein product [Mytilus edulis]